jgi:virulence factor Mce-like protein
MSQRRGAASLVASPVLVGAVTVLVTVIAVFIAYNANAGLPFVPTYDVRAELPGGAKLVEGNEVRVGGFRVGVVDDIRPKVIEQGGESKSIALVSMKLDKVVEPLARDTQIVVRPRSALGLKYVQVTPGSAEKTFDPGDTIPLRNASEQLELEDLLSTFDEETRTGARTATEGFGNAFAGRGQSLNVAIRALNPLFTRLRPVMRNLSDPETELDQFFLQIGRAARQVAPVADVQARLFTNMAETFEAFSRHPRELQLLIEKSPPTLDVAIRSFRVQRPFLADFADLSRRLRPAAQELPRSLPAVNDALQVGTPVLPRTAILNEGTGVPGGGLKGVFKELDDLASNPRTMLALQDLETTFDVTAPALAFIGPYQVVCNYFNYFWNPLGEHISQPVAGGTGQRVLLKGSPSNGEDELDTQESDRKLDVPSDEDPKAEPRPGQSEPRAAFHGQARPPAVDADGNADCQIGQSGYLEGPLVPEDGTGSLGRYPPSTDPKKGGGSHVVTDPDTPGNAGGTFKSRELGITSTRDRDIERTLRYAP